VLKKSGGSKSTDLPRSILDNLLEGCQVIGPDYRYLYVNDAVVRQGRTTREALLGRTMMECYPGIDRTPMFAVLQQCLRDHSPATLENEFTFPDGTMGWFELRFEPLPEGTLILSVDITDRKRAEIALRRTMRTLTTLSKCNRTLVRATEEQKLLQDVCNLLIDPGGYQAASIEFWDQGSVQEVARAANRMGTGPHKTLSSISLEVCVKNAPIGTLTIHTAESGAFDQSERALLEEIALDLGFGIEIVRARVTHTRTEEQLIAVQRLEAVGRLAGGVAHDFNNILSIILVNCSFALEQLHESDPIREDIGQALDAGKRAAHLTRQLLAFSRKQVMEPQVTNVNSVVLEIKSMLHRLLSEDIDIDFHPGNDLGNVLVDPGQLEQVIMNLAVNARDAMPKGGKLTIETDNVELDEEYARGHISVKPGRYVRLSVADTGTGMSEEVRNRVFEPFFTTKEQGKGTGLGLSTVYGIVKQSGGNIWVYSEPDHGTTFKVYLPRVDDPVTDRKRESTPVASGGSETILLVEDDASLRRAAARILQSAGYQVISAGDGTEALRLCKKHRAHVALVLTDVVMPDMGGKELANRVKKFSPKLKVLFTSGYTDDAIVRHGVLDPGTRFIGKPFSTSELTRKVREVLDEE
jgi:PAS domain S-box-containing protein